MTHENIVHQTKQMYQLGQRFENGTVGASHLWIIIFLMSKFGTYYILRLRHFFFQIIQKYRLKMED